MVPILERTTEPYGRALKRLDDVLLDDRYPPRVAQARLELRALVGGLRARVGVLGRHPGLARALLVGPLRLLIWIANILIFSAILQLGLLLPMVETFHRVTFAGIGLNALAIPVMTVLLALALPTNLISVMAPAVAVWPAKLLGVVMGILLGLTHLPGLTAWLSYRVSQPPWWVAWGFCGAFVLVAWALRVRARATGATLGAAAVFVVLVALHPFPAKLRPGRLEITVLDCGHGDAAFLVLPDRTTILVDAGGSRTRSTREGDAGGRRWDPGEEIVSPYLWSRGINHIDILVVSHIRPDDMGDLEAIMANFHVGEFWHAIGDPSPGYTELLAQAANRGISVRTLYAGDTIRRGDASLRVLWPPRDKTSSGGPNRGDLLVMRVSVAGASIMLAGDADRKVERKLLASAEPLESDMLVVAQRGSRPSSETDFMARVAPRVAIVSTEGGASGTLPPPERLSALRKTGALILRPDADGATTIAWEGGGFSIRNYGGSGALLTARAAAAVTGGAACNVP